MQYLSFTAAYVGSFIMTDPNERAGVEAMDAFFHQFGPLDDVYTRVLWEVLLEELYGIDSSSYRRDDDPKETH